MRFSAVLLLVVALLSVLSVFTVADDPSAINACLYYFYGQDCPRCAATDTYLDQLQLKYPHLQVQGYEIYYNKDNFQLLQQYFAAYEVPVPSQGVPIVFIPGSYFVGEEPIFTLLEQRIESSRDGSCPRLDTGGAVGVVGKKSSKNVLDTLTFGRLTGAAFSEVAKPTALMVLVIFLCLLALFHRGDIITGTILFSVGLYLGLFLLGLGFFSWFIDHPAFGDFAAKTLALLALLLGLFVFKKFVHGGYKGTIQHKLWWILTTQGVFLVGFIVSVLYFGSMSTIFLALRTLINNPGTRWAVVPLLFYYCLIAVLIFLVLGLIYLYLQQQMLRRENEKGKYSKYTRERWEIYHQRMIYLTFSIIAMLVGFVVLFG